MLVYVAQVSREGRGETDFEEQHCVNLCIVTPPLPLVWAEDSPTILCCSLYSVELFIAW